jgi:hypothetical protein
MRRRHYRAVDTSGRASRREFVGTVGACAAAAASRLVLAGPSFGAEPAQKVETNIDAFLAVPKGPHALPGPFPGKVVRARDVRALVGEQPEAKVVAAMVEKGITTLTGKDLAASYKVFFEPSDLVGIKVNPVGAPLIHTRPEVVEALVAWLVSNGTPAGRIVIWDRFDYMLKDAGYTKERFGEVRIEGLQTMDEAGDGWKGKDGRHVSTDNFDQNAFYFAKGVFGKGVRGYENDAAYLNQHVFDGEYSYFGKLVSERLTKIINVAAYKNTGQGISMATKNLGYGALCNTGRLHAPLFFQVNTEVLAAPAIRNKLVLNVTDGLRAQYDGGPDKNAQFVYDNHSLYFATDPFALDMACHREMVAKRKAMGVTVDENPRYTEYLRYAERLGLGVVDPGKTSLLEV